MVPEPEAAKAGAALAVANATSASAIKAENVFMVGVAVPAGLVARADKVIQ